jgi:hypothetical protein
MTKPTITVTGQRQLKRALKDIDGAMADLKLIHADAAKIVEQRAETLAPKETRRLAKSVRSSGTKSAGVVRAGSSSVDWAGPVHFGWPSRNIAPQPFLYDALDQRSDEVIAVYQRRVNAVIKRNGLA